MTASDRLFLEALLDTNVRQTLLQGERSRVLDRYDLPVNERRVLMAAPVGTPLEILAVMLEAARMRTSLAV